MKYALLIYGGAGYAALTDEEGKELYARHEAFGAKYAELITSGLELQDPATARSVRHHADHSVVTEGPFAETTEVLGGFYVVDVASREQAVEIA